MGDLGGGQKLAGVPARGHVARLRPEHPAELVDDGVASDRLDGGDRAPRGPLRLSELGQRRLRQPLAEQVPPGTEGQWDSRRLPAVPESRVVVAPSVRMPPGRSAAWYPVGCAWAVTDTLAPALRRRRGGGAAPVEACGRSHVAERVGELA